MFKISPICREKSSYQSNIYGHVHRAAAHAGNRATLNLRTPVHSETYRRYATSLVSDLCFR